MHGRPVARGDDQRNAQSKEFSIKYAKDLERRDTNAILFRIAEWGSVLEEILAGALLALYYEILFFAVVGLAIGGLDDFLERGDDLTI